MAYHNHVAHLKRLNVLARWVQGNGCEECLCIAHALDALRDALAKDAEAAEKTIAELREENEELQRKLYLYDN